MGTSIGYAGDNDSTSAILDSEGWLRTGDICYIDKDGIVSVVDRLKELIKYKGYQVTTSVLKYSNQQSHVLAVHLLWTCSINLASLQIAFV